MKDRLLRILQEENMTSNKFAELMEVRPSNISHLLAGRNYPNFEFVGRMLLRFPNLNPDWLINANGNMSRDNKKDLFGLDKESQNNVQEIEELQFTASDDQVIAPDLPEDEIDNTDNNESLPDKEEVSPLQEQTKYVGVENMQAEDVKIEQEHSDDLKKAVITSQKEDDQVSSSEQIISNSVNYDNKDQIDKIIVFYKDKTFDTYTSR